MIGRCPLCLSRAVTLDADACRCGECGNAWTWTRAAVFAAQADALADEAAIERRARRGRRAAWEVAP